MAAVNNHDLPVILIRDHEGKVFEKISVKEWLKRTSTKEANNFQIKLYRQALEYYATEELTKAEDLLLYLTELTEYSHYEYIERLANIYRRQVRPDKERCLLLLAYRSLKNDPIAPRINQRLEKLADAFLPKDNLLNQAF